MSGYFCESSHIDLKINNKLRNFNFFSKLKEEIYYCVSFQHYFRSSHSEVFCKKGVLKNFTKFRGKHPCQSLFFNKVAGLRQRKETLAGLQFY